MPYANSAEHKAAKARWYQKNKALTIKRSMEHKHRDIAWFKDLKAKKALCGCANCGAILPPEDYDFHHTDPSTKISSVADRLGTVGRVKVLEEINKCELWCRSCHSTLHNNWHFHGGKTTGHYPFHKP